MSTLSLNTLFLKYLDQVFCVRSHLLERFSEISEHDRFIDIGQAITLVCQQSEKQLTDLMLIYQLLDTSYSFELCQELIDCEERAFEDVIKCSGNIFSRNLAMLYYLHAVECTEQSGFQLLTILADKITHHEISGLLAKCRKDLTARFILTDQLMKQLSD